MQFQIQDSVDSVSWSGLWI